MRYTGVAGCVLGDGGGEQFLAAGIWTRHSGQPPEEYFFQDGTKKIIMDVAWVTREISAGCYSRTGFPLQEKEGTVIILAPHMLAE